MADAAEIANSAKELGFDRCGIIPVEMMSGYEEKLNERMEHFPQTRAKYEDFISFAHLNDAYPWAKSVVVCSFWYGRYRIPDNLQGSIAKYYLTDGRRNAESQGFQASAAFENYLKGCGFQTATDRDFGITALRWAAMQAGLGIVRKNNFFYTEKGSYQHLEAFLIDEPLKYIAGSQLRPCADKCDLCRRACPTGSLEAPYMMCRNTCVSCLTTWDGWDLSAEPLQSKFGKWIFGCDACQDACPYNKNAWKAEQEFPGLEELSKCLTWEEIVLADYDWLESVLQPKLWYIPKGKAWRYKTNALNAMLNNYTESYLPVIKKACRDEHEEVRNMADWVLTRISEGNK
jgi:epoxyqueuosine reductase